MQIIRKELQKTKQLIGDVSGHACITRMTFCILCLLTYILDVFSPGEVLGFGEMRGGRDGGSRCGGSRNEINYRVMEQISLCCKRKTPLAYDGINLVHGVPH